MNPMNLALISLAAMSCCTIVGMTLAAKLKDHHLTPPSLEIVKASRYVLIGLVALTLGLLISSAKDSFEDTAKELRYQASQFIVLNSLLEAYGSNGASARQALHNYLNDEIFRLDLASKKGKYDGLAVNLGNNSAILKNEIITLKSNDETEFFLKKKAIEIGLNIISTRWKIYEDIDDNSDDHLLIALIFWSSAIFFSLGLISPKNFVTFTSLSFSILCTSYAIFMISELESPYQGIMSVSATPLKAALEQINR